jgi:hypothetical protein
MGMWHHPCALGLTEGWQTKFICASPMLDCYGSLVGDSGSGLFRYDSETDEYLLIGVQSSGAGHTNMITALDSMVNFGKWLDTLMFGDAGQSANSKVCESTVEA